jgi:hypothetical protein
MRTIGLLIGIVAVAALAGCGNNVIRPPGFIVPSSAYQCTLDVDCVVYVSVTSTTPCVITVDKPEIEIKGSSRWTGIRHLIHWDLDERAVDAKFRFDGGNGVVLKRPDPDDQISEAGPVGGGIRYQLRDKNTNYYAYDYGINVVQKGTSNRCSLDPKFYNN